MILLSNRFDDVFKHSVLPLKILKEFMILEGADEDLMMQLRTQCVPKHIVRFDESIRD